MHGARAEHQTVLLMNGQILVTGGNVAPAYPGPSAELYDPSTKTWTITDSMHDNRDTHTASVLQNGKVLVAGGMGSWYNTFSSAELYDPTTRNWTNADNIFVAIQDRTASILNNSSMETFTSPDHIKYIESTRKIFMSENEKASLIDKLNFTTTKNKQLH
ncbi:unnamed protein product [Adineta steineri]|uniref:Uncharacterized protein n=1 Tax=Adineta steineri TaxID=433720 RepID=A0A815DXW5_9BILA|nr:unnamed protein product [Adineta steineri]CAF4043485.1 unnamed protein product [Adineta steineri]